MNTLKITKELIAQMEVKAKRIYQSTSIPNGYMSEGILTWSNNDDQWVITLSKTGEFTGHFYDWNEGTQAWDDAHDVQMTAEQIKEIILKDHLVLATLGKRIA